MAQWEYAIGIWEGASWIGRVGQSFGVGERKVCDWEGEKGERAQWASL